jgi:stage V sporulation protein AB
VAGAEGVAVGAGFAALVVVLRVAVRLAALTRTGEAARAYQWAMVFGAAAAGAWEAWPEPLRGGVPLAAALALGLGTFVGLLAAALAETAAALPLAGRRLGLTRYLAALVLAVVAGKAAGAVAWLLVPGLFARPPA